MVGKTEKPTATQRRRLDAIARLPCLACVQEGKLQPNRTEVHHIVDKGYRRLSGGHDSVLPLCGFHHRGVLPAHPRMRLSTAEATYGPSLALAKRAFVARYGSERELLAKVNALLEVGR